MPPGHEARPSAQTSVPGSGRVGQPGEDHVEEDGAPDEHVVRRLFVGAPAAGGQGVVRHVPMIPHPDPDSTDYPPRRRVGCRPSFVVAAWYGHEGGGAMRSSSSAAGVPRAARLRRAAADTRQRRVTEVVLHDTDAGRLAAIGAGARARPARRAAARPRSPSRPTSTRRSRRRLRLLRHPRRRARGPRGRRADRPGLGRAGPGDGRRRRHRVRTAHGAGRRRHRRRVARLAPDAWVINFTNPAGLVTEAMAPPPRRPRHRHLRLAGRPRPPGGPRSRARPRRPWFDYAGLNHLGWLRGLRVDGRDLLPGLLADAPSARLLRGGPALRRRLAQSLGAMPNEYLHYYYFNREAVAADQGGRQTRGAFLLDQQAGFYAVVRRAPPRPWSLWDAARRARGHLYGREPRGGRARASAAAATWSPAATKGSRSR